MATTITLTYDNQDYILEFTRGTVSNMEKNGFRLNNLENMPNYIPFELFAGSFAAHHRNVKRELIGKIYDAQRRKKELISTLVDMYIETVDLLKDEKIDEEEAPTWQVNH